MMKSALSNRSVAAWKPLALASSLTVLTSAAIAQTDTEQKLAPVTVSASRFESTEAPIGATVITAEQIRQAGVGNVNEAIRKIGGVYGRQNLNGTSDYQLDLRGFGGFSDQNMVVMVDGVRLSENEQATALMSSIPIESVERIEIVRGGSSVLYGEGATGGTIQIITKRGADKGTHGAIFAEVGNRNSNELRASLSKGWDGFSVNANVSSLHTDNYRENNALKQENFSGGMQWKSDAGRIGIRIDAARQDSRLAGALTYDEYLKNPRQTFTPDDFASINSNRYTLFGERRLGNWELASDLSYRDKEGNSFFSPGPSSAVEGHTAQFSPRVRNVYQLGDMRNEFVTGFDFSRSVRDTNSAFSNISASQDSAAAYARNEVRIGKTRVAFGARHEQFDQTARGSATYDQAFSLNAWDMQGSYQFAPMVEVFTKIGRSYRVANVDDNAFTRNNTPLKPQKSNDFELGTSLGDQNKKLTLRAFRHNLKNEIVLDPTIFANINLDGTRRQGLEAEATTSLSRTFSLAVVAQHVSAKFTDGLNSGKEVTLVPQNTATIRLTWLPGDGQTADIGIQWIDSQRYANDFSNACASKIPAYTTLDGRYAIRVGAWEFAITGSNLTDKRYFSQAFGDCRDSASIYTDPGRSVKFSVRKDF
jgi:iron complex outermembrane receptor protein